MVSHCIAFTEGCIEGTKAQPAIFGCQFLAQQHRFLADCLLDDPGGLDNRRDELEGGVPAFIRLLTLSLQKPADYMHQLGLLVIKMAKHAN